MSVTIYISWRKRVGLLLWEDTACQEPAMGHEWIRGGLRKDEFRALIDEKMKQYSGAKVLKIAAL